MIETGDIQRAKARAENEQRFRAWVREVDAIVIQTAGISIHDLADISFRDYFDEGMPAAEVAQEALENEGFEF